MTSRIEFHKLDLVPRSVATLLALAIVAVQSATGAFHTHATTDGPVDEHRHGPAIHHHGADEGAGRAPHVDEPESTSPIITVAIPAATAPDSPAVVAVITAVVVSPALCCAGWTSTIAPQSHDPPSSARPLLRGPPNVLPA